MLRVRGLWQHDEMVEETPEVYISEERVREIIENWADGHPKSDGNSSWKHLLINLKRMAVEKDSTIVEVTDTDIVFKNHKGKLQDSPISALPQRLTEARKKIRNVEAVYSGHIPGPRP